MKRNVDQPLMNERKKKWKENEKQEVHSVNQRLRMQIKKYIYLITGSQLANLVQAKLIICI